MNRRKAPTAAEEKLRSKTGLTATFNEEKMKALAIDSASGCMTVSAKNDDITTSLSLDIGPKQSQELLPAIDFVLKKVDLKINKEDLGTFYIQLYEELKQWKIFYA